MAAGIVVGANSFAEALVIVVVIVALLCVALSISVHMMSKGNVLSPSLVLNDVSNDGIDENDLGFFVGKDGKARTVLRPAGVGEFEGVKLDVLSDGEFIEKDEPIRVLRVEGNRIVVGKA